MNTISTDIPSSASLDQVDELNLCAALITLGFPLASTRDFTERDTSSQNVTGRNGMRKILWSFQSRNAAGQSLNEFRFAFLQGLPKRIEAFSDDNPIPAMRLALHNYRVMQFASREHAPLYNVDAGLAVKASTYPEQAVSPVLSSSTGYRMPYLASAVAMVFGCRLVSADFVWHPKAPFVLAASPSAPVSPESIDSLARDSAALADPANRSAIAMCLAFLINRSKILHFLQDRPASSPILRADPRTAAVFSGDPAALSDQVKRRVAAHLGL